MCYAKPGPRCSNHASKKWRQAREDYEASPTEQNRKAEEEAKHEYFTTPQGIRQLREKAQYEKDPATAVSLSRQADEGEAEREAQLAAYYASRGEQAPDNQSKDLVSTFNFLMDAVTEKDGWRNFDEKLAANPNTPVEVLVRLSQSENSNLYPFLAANPNTPVDTLHQVWDFSKRIGDPEAIEALHQNPNTSDELRSEIEEDYLKVQYGLYPKKWREAQGLGSQPLY